ncbi:hypothetical protein [Streptomyces sp. LaPpAH-108]|uniref:hypothetical protein n=1 Tax=Streptomyces sp. LaPpAH-108 TaxID=1155714 RepID=UPI0018F888DB|nr:hypothetical protein [Streptomyces sp. LaPpAH-108]
MYVRMVRAHIARGVAPDGRLFWAARGGRLTSNEYCAAWETARGAVLTPAEVESEMAAVPYCLRHAAVSLWIKQGVDPVEAAYRAGHSVAMLYRFYAKLLKGSSAHANSLIQMALEEAEDD